MNVAAGSTKMLYLVASATVTGGTSLTNVQYRLTSANAIDTYDDTVSDVLSDGVHVAAMYKPPTTSSATYWFQARTLGGSFTVGDRELVAQTMPHFTVFEATGGAATIPNNRSWHTLKSSTVPSLPAAARGLYGSSGSGYTYLTYNSAKTYAEVRFELETPYPEPYKFWKVGWIGVQPSGYRKLEGMMSDWEQLGLDVGQPFTLRLQMRGLCSGGPSLSVTKSRFQVAVVPDAYAFTNASCSANPSVCCANNPGVCQAYECSMALPLTTGVSERGAATGARWDVGRLIRARIEAPTLARERYADRDQPAFDFRTAANFAPSLKPNASRQRPKNRTNGTRARRHGLDGQSDSGEGTARDVSP